MVESLLSYYDSKEVRPASLRFAEVERREHVKLLAKVDWPTVVSVLQLDEAPEIVEMAANLPHHVTALEDSGWTALETSIREELQSLRKRLSELEQNPDGPFDELVAAFAVFVRLLLAAAIGTLAAPAATLVGGTPDLHGDLMKAAVSALVAASCGEVGKAVSPLWRGDGRGAAARQARDGLVADLKQLEAQLRMGTDNGASIAFTRVHAQLNLCLARQRTFGVEWDGKKTYERLLDDLDQQLQNLLNGELSLENRAEQAGKLAEVVSRLEPYELPEALRPPAGWKRSAATRGRAGGRR
jgi:hypothetical protein